MREAGLAGAEQVCITGGGAKSPLWRQIPADIFDVELVKISAQEGAAYGAALLAAVSSGAWPDVHSASVSNPVSAAIPPPAPTVRPSWSWSKSGSRSAVMSG